ncbi:hypothetical protein DSECCO2_556440 [anaerobic digester metagenome]
MSFGTFSLAIFRIGQIVDQQIRISAISRRTTGGFSAQGDRDIQPPGIGKELVYKNLIGYPEAFGAGKAVLTSALDYGIEVLTLGFILHIHRGQIRELCIQTYSLCDAHFLIWIGYPHVVKEDRPAIWSVLGVGAGILDSQIEFSYGGQGRPAAVEIGSVTHDQGIGTGICIQFLEGSDIL